jgi:ribosomal protein S18 acetylase RimI-like enzyme
MNIRVANLADARAVAEVHVSSWQDAYQGLIPDSYLARLSVDKRESAWRESIASGTPELWVAEEHCGVVGWVAFCPSRDQDAPRTTGEVGALYVLSSHWRQGIGRALWLTARRRLIERLFSRVTLWVLAENERAIRFYTGVGFLPDAGATRVSERDGKQMTEVRYEAALG